MDVPETLPGGQCAIYALIDPNDHLVYYIGQTQKPKKRFGQHLTSRRGLGAKADWLLSLYKRGQQPIMQILEIVTDKNIAITQEQKWIHHFIEQRMPLANIEARLRVPQSDLFQRTIMPLRQETIIWYGSPARKVWLPNGYSALVLSDLIEILQVDRSGQIQRIRSDPAISHCLLHAYIKTSYGLQRALVLTDWAIPLWLIGIQPSRITSEKYEFVLALKQKAGDVLQQHFSVDAEQTTRHEVAPEKEQTVPRSTLEKHIEAWQATKQKREAREAQLDARLAALEQHQAEVHARLASLEYSDGGNV